MFIEFVIQNQFFSYSLEEFALILNIPCDGACFFNDKWSLDELANGVPTDGPYQTNPPSPDDIISSIRINREGQVHRNCHEKEIDVQEYQILPREIVPALNPLEEIIRENIFCLGVSSSSKVSSSMSFSKFFFSVTLIASSSSKSSSTKGDVLDGGVVSSNVTLSDSLIFMVCLFRMIQALLFWEYPRKPLSYEFRSNLVR
nr:cytochrome P450 [Tanacetum cinerariifolium]